MRQHWWAIRFSDGLAWAHDSLLPYPAPISDLAAIMGRIQASDGTIFEITCNGTRQGSRPGQQNENQTFMTPTEYQVLRDGEMANMLQEEELAGAWRTSPPSWATAQYRTNQRR